MLWRARFVLIPAVLGCLLSLAMLGIITLDERGLALGNSSEGMNLDVRQRLLKQQKEAMAALGTAREAKKGWRPPLPGSLEVRQRIFWPKVRNFARKYDLDPALVMAVVQVESTFNPYALSKKGAAGLMQIVPNTAEHLGLEDPFDPEANIEAGTRYLKWLNEVFDGDINLILAAYNAGPSKVLLLKRVPRIRETRRYITRVKRYQEIFSSRFESLAQS